MRVPHSNLPFSPLPPRNLPSIEEARPPASRGAVEGRGADLPVALGRDTSRLLDTLAEGGRVTVREAGFLLALYRTLSFDALVGDIEPQIRRILGRTEIDELVVFARTRDVEVALHPDNIEALCRARLMTKVTAGILRKAPSGAMISSGGLLAVGLAIPDLEIAFLAACVGMLAIGLGVTPYWVVKHRRKLREEMGRAFARPEIQALMQQKRDHLLAVVEAHSGDLESALRAGWAERLMRACQASALVTRAGGITKIVLSTVAGAALMAASAFSLVSGLVYSALKTRLRRKSLRDPAMLLAHALVQSTEKRRAFVFKSAPFKLFVKANKAELKTLLDLPPDAKTRHILKTLKFPQYAKVREQVQAECRRDLLRQALDGFAREMGSSLEEVIHDDAALGKLIKDYAVVTAARIAGNQTLAEGVVQSLKAGTLMASAGFIAGPAWPAVVGAGGGVFVLGSLVTFMFSRMERARFLETLTKAVEGRGVPLPSTVQPGTDEAGRIEAAVAVEIQMVVDAKISDVRRPRPPFELVLCEVQVDEPPVLEVTPREDAFTTARPSAPRVSILAARAELAVGRPPRPRASETPHPEPLES